MNQIIKSPSNGQAISLKKNHELNIPDFPIIPFIEGDGIGVDIMPAMQTVVDAVVKKIYSGSKKIEWLEVFAGEKAANLYGNNHYLPEETLDALETYIVSIKGPLATPVGGGIRSLNVAMRQKLDLFVCLRPIQYFEGVPSPLKNPEKTDMVIFRENTEDIYAGIEYQQGTHEVNKIMGLLREFHDDGKVRFPDSSAIGIKPVSMEGSQRLIHKAIQFAIDNNRRSVTLVHKGNIMKFTEGGFKEWGYAIAKKEFGAHLNESGEIVLDNGIRIKDCIADAFLQEILLRPERYDVVATLNLNGDYISDALAAQVGGIGISPGANLSNNLAIFEATHGTAPDIAGKNIANPSSLILSAQMMLSHIQWNEAANALNKAFRKTLLEKKVTADFSVHMGVNALSTSDFAQAIIENLEG
ncbi:NADP-dependent isocitrate dehydrogenase [Methylophilaceae bacterium]|nr:NADP-dependent isocitrate dehydrogenase [Methylophilaceae bacterium]